MRKGLILSVFLALGLANPCLALDDQVGTAGAQFLKLAVDARSVGLAEAYSSLAEGPSSIYWNPAGLTSIKGQAASFTYADYIDGVNYGFLGYGQRVENVGVFGLGITYLDCGDLKKTKEDKWGTYLAGETSNFQAKDLALSLSYAQDFSQFISYGATIKLIHQVNEDETADGAAIDVGMLGVLGANRLAFSFHNGGKMSKFLKEDDPLPWIIRSSGSHRFKNNLIIALEVSTTSDNNPSVSVGLEQTFFKRLALRCGYKYLDNDRNPNAACGLAGGIGMRDKAFQIDYGVASFGDLGQVHRFSFGVNF